MKATMLAGLLAVSTIGLVLGAPPAAALHGYIQGEEGTPVNAVCGDGEMENNNGYMLFPGDGCQATYRKTVYHITGARIAAGGTVGIATMCIRLDIRGMTGDATGGTFGLDTGRSETLCTDDGNWHDVGVYASSTVPALKPTGWGTFTVTCVVIVGPAWVDCYLDYFTGLEI